MKNDVYLKNGIEAYKKGDYKEALKYFRRLVSESKNYYIGLTLVRLKNYEDATAHLKSYLKKATDYALMIQVFLVLGYAYAELENFRVARKYLQKAIELDFNNSRAYAALGYVYYKLNQYNEAIDSLKKAIEIDENNATAHNSLGYIYSDLDMDIEQAVKEIETALRLKPDYGAFLDSMGWIYYKKGDFAEAKKYLARALEKLPDNPEIKQHFRDVVVKEVARRKESID